MRLAARSRIIAGALVTAAVAAPAASAHFDLEPATTGLPQSTAAAPAVRPNPHHGVSQAGPPILKSATASQLAEIHPREAAASHALAYKPTHSKPYSTAALNGYVSSPTNRVPAVVHITTHSNPFDWGDAAIGAAGGLVVSLLIVGGTVVVTQRRQPEASRAKAVVG